MTPSMSGSTTVQILTDMGDSVGQEPTSETHNLVNTEEALLAKLLEASSCERAGDIRQAATLYREIVVADAAGTWGQSAQKALEAIQSDGGFSEVETLNRVDGNGEALAAPVFSTSDLVNSPNSEEMQVIVGDTATSGTIAGTRITQDSSAIHSSSADPSVHHKTGRSRLSLLRWKLAGVTVLPVMAVSLAALWWLPRGLEPQWNDGAMVEQEAMIPSSEVQLFVERQRQLGLWISLLATLGALLVTGGVTQTLMQHLQFLAHQADDRSQGKPLDESGLSVLGSSTDEVGELARGIHHLGHYLNECEQTLADAENNKRIDLESATRETQRLQQQVIELLVQIEEVRSGNLTARAPMIDGKVGSIADAFNATIDSLRYIVAQVVEVTQSLTQGAQGGEASVRQVADSALEQSQTLKGAREDVAAMVVSIEQVSDLTQSSAQIARDAIEAARQGDVAMDRTVVSMEKIRTAVSNTSKRAKRLAESAQEVSQILAIVTGISEQANLLAFNASIEAARAGEQGQGFRQVSDEVRNLAAQVSESAQDIERLVQSIQEETASVINVLEVGTSEVVNGTQLVNQTQKTLFHLTTLNREIDTALQRVAANTTEQTATSQQVNQTMKSVAGVSLANAEAAREVVEVLQKLLREVSTLQTSVDRFQV